MNLDLQGFSSVGFIPTGHLRRPCPTIVLCHCFIYISLCTFIDHGCSSECYTVFLWGVIISKNKNFLPSICYVLREGKITLHSGCGLDGIEVQQQRYLYNIYIYIYIFTTRLSQFSLFFWGFYPMKKPFKLVKAFESSRGNSN